MFVPFGQFAPDLQDFQNQGGLISMANALPTQQGYRHFKQLAPFSDALASRCYGAITARDSSSNVYQYAGTATGLYRLLSSAWSDVTKLSTTYALTENDDRWEFVQWGQTIIGTNGTDDLQVITLGGANFADLAGTPPAAKHIGVVRDFVVVGNTEDDPSEVRWSGFNDATTWTVSSATQAGLQPLRAGAGWVQAIVGGEYGVVVAERGVFLMQYVGTPVIWQFDEILPDVGTPAGSSVTRIGDLVFFLGQDGFYSIVGGKQWKNIGKNRVDDFFWNDVDNTKLANMRAAVNKNTADVYWAYVSKTASSSIPDRLLIYNYINDKWAYVKQSMQEMLMTAVGGTSLDDLTYLGSIDDLSISLDDRVFAGDTLSTFGGFDSSHKLALFAGSPLDAEFETREGELSGRRRSRVHFVRPVIEGGNAPSVSIGHRTELNDAVIYTGDVSPNRNGDCPFRVNDRYTRAKVKVTGTFTNALGIDYEANPSGA